MKFDNRITRKVLVAALVALLFGTWAIVSVENPPNAEAASKPVSATHVFDELRDLHTVRVPHNDQLAAGDDLAIDTEIDGIILVAIDNKEGLRIEFHRPVKGDFRAAKNSCDTDLDPTEA